jgi:maltooligosyltrehalose trehalohydrolase
MNEIQLLGGAHYRGNDVCEFTVWAPEKTSMTVQIVSPHQQSVMMKKQEQGYFQVSLSNVPPGSRYLFQPEGGQRLPDPCSCYQPLGVHGPSEVIDHDSFQWRDHAWKGIPFEDLIIYEVHVGTFTESGTFEAIIPRLDALLEIGINAIELMPVSQFPGERNWGYDGVYPYAVQNSYGGPVGLKQLVNACHEKGMAVFLDVVYNHLGPEGNYLSAYGPYFTNKYSTPWGAAINFDGEWSDGVREYFAGNALYWFRNFHLDGLRLDAIHMVFDQGAVPFWELVNERVQRCSRELGRPLYMVAESDLNSPRVVQEQNRGGLGFTAQWLDDFHHALYVLLDKNGRERYYDFGSIDQLAKAYKEGFVHSGEYVKFRKRKHGRSSKYISGNRFVAFNLNHDQVGNRVNGERLCVLVDLERLKIAAAALLLSPYVPLLFMGEEYADRSPFYYFVSHSDPALIRAVREGRKEEFKNFASEGEPPDAQDPETFYKSKINWDLRERGDHAIILEWHRALISLRRELPAFRNFKKEDVEVGVVSGKVLMIHRRSSDRRNRALCYFNFSEEPISCTVPADVAWKIVIRSREMVSVHGTVEPYDRDIEASAMMIDPLSVIVLESTA